MSRCSVHGTVLNGEGNCYWCSHPEESAPLMKELEGEYGSVNAARQHAEHVKQATEGK